MLWPKVVNLVMTVVLVMDVVMVVVMVMIMRLTGFDLYTITITTTVFKCTPSIDYSTKPTASLHIGVTICFIPMTITRITINSNHCRWSG